MLEKCKICGKILRYIYGLNEYRCEDCGAEYELVLKLKSESVEWAPDARQDYRRPEITT